MALLDSIMAFDVMLVGGYWVQVNSVLKYWVCHNFFCKNSPLVHALDICVGGLLGSLMFYMKRKHKKWRNYLETIF